MSNTQRFWRSLFFILLITALCGGMALPIAEGTPARAAPQRQGIESVVISEFRTRGTDGANDEFVELYNPTNTSIPIGGWTIRRSTGCGTASGTPLDTIAAGTSLGPGQYYLSAGASYSGATEPDYRHSSDWSIADDGGIAVLDSSITIMDQVGMCDSTEYLEGSPLAPMSAFSEQSYERRTGGSAGNCNDTDNNAADFVLNSTSSNPQNLFSPPLACLGVVNVTSSVDNGTYSSGDIPIQVTFSAAVDVTGFPQLLLETGATDTAAIYDPATSTATTLTFIYTIEGDDISTDLDYVSTNALTLNGGTIIGTFGNAILTLPVPGSPRSLGSNKDIVINSLSNPVVTSIRRQIPTAERTNLDTLRFRVTFSESVINVDNTDFAVTGTTGTPAVTRVSDSIYDVTISGGDLAGFNGTVGLGLSPVPPLNITDTAGNALVTTPPSINETYIVDNTAPTATITRLASQPISTDILPVYFTATFNEDINVSSFTASDIRQDATATATGVTWNITASPSDPTRTFTISAVSLTSNGTLIPSIPADRVNDVAGNGNSPGVSSDTVTFEDTTRPSVTINQVSTQADPTTSVPVRFAIVFSETIDTRVFSTGDITQTGTATGITWSITDSGDHRNFALSATAVTGGGTLIPSIPANRVTDLVGNSNLASTSTDNIVTFNSSSSPIIVISEFRTRGPNGADDEFIELYNPTSNWIDISGWKINASNDTGSVSTRATIPASTILRSGQYYLITKSGSGGYSGNVSGNLTYGSGITDGGGIALLTANNTRVDQVGMSATSAYKEGTTLSPLTGTSNQSYERELGGTSDSCQDTANNASDFSNIDPSNPQNYSFPLRLCGNPQLNPVVTTTTITADTPDSSLINGYVSVSVSVTGGSTPTGRVNITGANTNCSITLNSSGTGTCTVRFTSSGNKTLTATYLGDNTHLSSSDTEPHQVTTAPPTKTRVPTLPPPPPLVALNEFVPRPGHDWNLDGVVNTGDEYIEILNHGVIDVNLSGYSLDDEANIGSSPYRLPSVTLKPGERIVFYGSETGLLLSDGGDGVRLLKPNGQLADAYNYFVVRFPDQSYCRLPDNGGLDDWNQNCFPTPGLQNSLSGSAVNPPTSGEGEPLCPIADTLPDDFVFAECLPFGHNIWNPAYWDRFGWFDEKNLPESSGKWPVFVD